MKFKLFELAEYFGISLEEITRKCNRLGIPVLEGGTEILEEDEYLIFQELKKARKPDMPKENFSEMMQNEVVNRNQFTRDQIIEIARQERIEPFR